jgi:hypothetical protein
MSFCIGLWLRDTTLKLRQQGINMQRQALSQFQKTSTVIYTNNQRNQDTGWSWNTSNGTNEDLTWLIR